MRRLEIKEVEVRSLLLRYHSLLGLKTHLEVYSDPLSAPIQLTLTMRANMTPPVGPAIARPKSRPMVEEAVAVAKGRTRK